MPDWRSAREEDLLALIENRETESHYLDFKKRDSLLATSKGEKNERRLDVSKDISSFAHADGGAIIYGMEEEGDPPVASRLRGFKPGEMSKETLAQLIQSALPTMSGVFINPVMLESEDPASDSGTVVYVVEIPQSDTIHEARDGRFHRRDNTTTREMHRDEILDVLNRTKGPKLHLKFTVGSGGVSSALGWPLSSGETPAWSNWSTGIPMNIYAHNTAKIALYSLYRLFLETESLSIRVSDFTLFTSDDLAIDNPPGVMGGHSPWIRVVRRLYLPSDPPIFPGNRTHVGSFSAHVLARCPVGERLRIFWVAVAPDMRDAYGGVVLVREDGNVLALRKLPSEEVDSFFGT